MRYVLLAVALSALIATVDPVVVQERFDSDGYTSIEYVGGLHYEQRGGLRERLDPKVRSSTQVLRLVFCPNDAPYTSPVDVGAVEDIPFNYVSTIEQSSRFVYSLIGRGFSVERYAATSRVISMELRRDGILCRILIYTDYIKCYMSGGIE